MFSSSYRPRSQLKNLVIAPDIVDCSSIAKSMGVIFNNSLWMVPHVAAVWKSSFIHLRNIFKICNIISHDTSKTLIHAFATARISYCNSLLYGQPKCILRRLQSVLNSAAILIHLTSRHKHITPLLILLHWLPIDHKLTFKIVWLHLKVFKVFHLTISLILSSVIHLVDFLDPLINCYFVHLSLISRLTVTGHLLLQHSLFGMHLNSSLDLVIPFLLLNLSLRLGLLKFLMMLSYRMMMFHRTMM